LKADLLLLLTAAIWGFAFVAQRIGMSHMGPFTFNAIRFTLGAISLLPVLFWLRKRGLEQSTKKLRQSFLPGLATGLALFAGASLQQIGLMGTSAGKAGFITGLYVIFVPLLGLLWGRRTHLAHWVGAVLAVAGLYLLSVQTGFVVSKPDLIVLAGAFMWAVHVHLIARYASIVGPIRLSVLQFAICGLLSAIAGAAFETFQMHSIVDGLGTLLYSTFLSVGVAYTLQVVAQRWADPTHAVIILSLEGTFAALGGWLILNEVISPRGLWGCALILVGMLISQALGNQRRINKMDQHV
jgi:drug/metabolite transporter (DMT)-like permease